MSFLFPLMAAGLAALAIPTLIHMIARHKYPVRDFPAIHLLRYERRDNAFARRLIDPLQLLLRLLLLALLVLAMVRLFSPTLSEDPAPRNLIVIVDTSGSMRMQIEDPVDSTPTTPLAEAREIAEALVGEISLPSRCALITAGDKVRIDSALGPDPAPVLAALEQVAVTDGAGPGLVHAVAQCAEMVRGRKEVKSQIVVLTDGRASAFETRNQRDLQTIRSMQEAMGDQLDLIVVDVGNREAENLGIVTAELRGRSVRIGDDAHVVARVRNFGQTNQVARMQLNIAGKKERPFRGIKLEAGEEVVVDLTSQVNRSLRGFAGVTLDSDDSARHDNVFAVPFVVASSRRVLIVNGAKDAAAETSLEASALADMGEPGSGGGAIIEEAAEVIDGARILQYALNPGRELGLAFGTGIDTTQITPDALPAQTLNKYDTIVLYDVSRLTDQALSDMHAFVNDGRSLLIICSAHVNAIEFNSTLGAGSPDRPALSPVLIGGNELVLQPPAAVNLNEVWDTARHPGVTYNPGPWLAPYRDRRQGDLATIRFLRLRSAERIEEGANVLMQGDGHAMAVEADRGAGKVVVFTFGLELGRGNIAMTTVFPMMTWRLMSYLAGRLYDKPPDTLTAAAPSALDVSETEFSFANELQISPATDVGQVEDAEADTPVAAAKAVEPLTLDVNDQKTVFVDGLPVGHYWLSKARLAGGGAATGYRRPIAVNPDVKESRMEKQSEDDTHAVLGEQARIIPPAEVAGITPHGSEIWRWVIIGLIAAYVLEAFVAYITGVRRDKKAEEMEAAEQAEQAAEAT